MFVDEVVLSDGGFRILGYKLSEFDDTDLTSASDANLPSEQFIVTGGGRGITREVALAMGREFGLRLQILGSSDLTIVPDDWFSWSQDQRGEFRKQVIQNAIETSGTEPPIRAWQRVEQAAEVVSNLRRYADAGIDAQYHRCDLRSSAEIQATVQNIISRSGPIAGLIHGAGFEKSADIIKKTAKDIDQTLAIKCDAMETLIEQLDGQPLKHVLAFGSISGRLGGLGQIDYCFANDALAKITARLRATRPAIRATTFDWHSWDGVGMAVRPETRRIKERLGLVYMGLEEGVQRVLDEVRHGLPEAEVLITTPEHLTRMGAVLADQQLPPLLDSIAEDGAKYPITLSPTNDPFLVEHRFKDRPLLPLVMGIEAFLQAASVSKGPGANKSWVLSNVEVHGPLRCASDQPVEAYVELQPESSSGLLSASLFSRFRNPAGQLSPKARLHFSALIQQDAKPNFRIQPRPIESIDDFNLRPLAIRDDLVLYHGPIFRMVEQIGICGDGAIAAIRVPEIGEVAGAGRASEGWITSPAVVDACLFACGVHLYVGDGGAVAVPMGIERISILRPCESGQTLWLRLQQRSNQHDRAIYDFVLQDREGTPLLVAEGYAASIVARAATASKVLGARS
jgi:NAD(P)-dependent dehydrogenase (short-subunit alcohol dehydrogenase family)